MEDYSWIKLHRKLLENPIMQNANLLQLFIFCVLKANHKPNEFIFNDKLVKVNRGSFITGRFEIAKSIKQNPASVYKNLKKLELLGYISLNSNNKFTMLTVIKYDTYQSIVTTKEQQSNNKVTTKEQQSNNKVTQTRMNKNDKNDKNEENEENTNLITVKKKTSCLFENSEYYDFNRFKERFLSNNNYQQYDVRYYYEAVRNWSAGKGELRKDWIAVARNFALTDKTPRMSKNGNVETIKLAD